MTLTDKVKQTAPEAIDELEEAIGCIPWHMWYCDTVEEAVEIELNNAVHCHRNGSNHPLLSAETTETIATIAYA